MFERLIDAFLDSIRMLKFFQVVRVFEGGVVLRWGQFHRNASPGRLWHWPFGIEEVLTTSVVTETMNVGPQSLTTLDGRPVVFSTVVTFRVTDPAAFLLSIEGAGQVIEDCTYGAVAAYVMSRTWDQLREVNRKSEPVAARELRDKVSSRARVYGVEIESVSISDISQTRSLRLLQQFTNKFNNTAVN